MAGDLPDGFSLADYIAKLDADPKKVATPQGQRNGA